MSISYSYAGTISGKIIYKGPPPTAVEHKVTRDHDFCGENRIRVPFRIHSSSKGLQDVVVNLDSPLINNHQTQRPNPIITNQDCTFVPHIITTRVDGSLELRNDDPILHNTHIRNKKKTFINVALVADGLPIHKRIKKPGVMSVECNAHKFMQAYIIAFDHPFYAITNNLGEFNILDVPSGEHELAIWHEHLGTLRTKVVVPPSGEISISLEYPSN